MRGGLYCGRMSESKATTGAVSRPEWAAGPQLEQYYDSEWGMPVVDERGMFERLVLEGFQAGLSWSTILAKREAFREAFAGFDPEAVAAFGEADLERLLADSRIIRNRQKIEAAIGNARATVALRDAEDLPAVPRGVEPGLASLVWSYRVADAPEPEGPVELPAVTPESAALAKDLKKRGFRFVGPTTMYALMQAVGVVNDRPAGSPRRAAVAKAVKKALAGQRRRN